MADTNGFNLSDLLKAAKEAKIKGTELKGIKVKDVMSLIPAVPTTIEDLDAERQERWQNIDLIKPLFRELYGDIRPYIASNDANDSPTGSTALDTGFAAWKIQELAVQKGITTVATMKVAIIGRAINSILAQSNASRGQRATLAKKAQYLLNQQTGTQEAAE